MRNKRYLYAIVFLLIIAFLTPPAVASQPKAVASYSAPNGIHVISYHPGWSNQAGLKSVWEELMRNTHFDEIKLLKQVEIHSGTSSVSGLYQGGIVRWSEGREEYRSDCKIIYYPDGGADAPALHMASTLAHEYGHHFTMYYLWLRERASFSNSSWEQTGFARIRGLSGDKQVSPDAEHKWRPAEIAAEDYVQLFGSPNARKMTSLADITQSNGSMRWGSYMYNFQPQDNMSLPLAAEVLGLREYWLGLAGRPTKDLNKPPTHPVLALTGQTGLNLVFEWTRSFDDKANPITYTLLEYNSLEAGLGTPRSYQVDGYHAERPIYYNESGVRYFRVLAADPEGLIVSSNLLKVDLDRPQFTQLPIQPVAHRISGSNRYETAARISQAGWVSADTVILARGDHYADALAGVTLAYQYNAPILLTPTNQLDEITRNEIRRLGAARIIILGGTGAVSQQIEDILAREDLVVDRIDGKDRFETAAMIASRTSPNGSQTAVIAYGYDFPDALAAAAYAARAGYPILLTGKDSVPAPTMTAIQQLGIENVIVVGGEAVISRAALKQIPGVATIRLSGANRFATAVEVAGHFQNPVGHMFVATGYNFADAVTGAALAAKRGDGILLVGKDMPLEVRQFIDNHGITEVTLFGGEGAVPRRIFD